MFNKKLKQELKETRELVQLLNYEIRGLLFEKERAKNPDKPILPPFFLSLPTVFESHEIFGITMPDVDKLKKKYRGSHAANY